jgi:hypothetical protein
MLLHKTRSYFALLAFAALTAGSGMASTVYTTFGSWASALTSTPTYAEALNYADNQVINQTLYVNNAYGSFVADATAAATTMNVSGTTFQDLQGEPLTIAAPTGGTNAVLMSLGANSVGNGLSSQTLTITLTDVNNNTQTYNVTTSSSAVANWAFTSSTAINTITISAPTGYDADLLDFWTGTYPNTGGTGQTGGTSSAPECATLLMVGGGLVFLGARRKYLQPMFN